MHSSSSLYAKTVFEIVHEESVKVYHLHIHVQREYSAEPSSLCVESSVTKEFPISPRFSPAFFHRDAISLLLRAHLCTVVDSMRRKLFVRKCSSREREALYNGNVAHNLHNGVAHTRWCVPRTQFYSVQHIFAYLPAFLYKLYTVYCFSFGTDVWLENIRY